MPDVFPTLFGTYRRRKEKGTESRRKLRGMVYGNDLPRRKSGRKKQFKTSNGKRGLKNAQNLSAEETAEKEGTRLPEKNGYRQRKKSAEKKTSEGQRKTVLLRDVFRKREKNTGDAPNGILCLRNGCKAAAKRLRSGCKAALLRGGDPLGRLRKRRSGKRPVAEEMRGGN